MAETHIAKRLLAGAGITIAVALTVVAGAYAATTGSKERPMTGIVVASDRIELSVPAQPGTERTLRVQTANVPGPSWIVVHLDDNGKPGMRIGLLHIDGGSNGEVSVSLEGDELTDELIVALHADRGVAGTFDFDMDRFEISPDKPYFVDGMEMATRVRVK